MRKTLSRNYFRFFTFLSKFSAGVSIASICIYFDLFGRHLGGKYLYEKIPWPSDFGKPRDFSYATALVLICSIILRIPIQTERSVNTSTTLPLSVKGDTAKEKNDHDSSTSKLPPWSLCLSLKSLTLFIPKLFCFTFKFSQPIVSVLSQKIFPYHLEASIYTRFQMREWKWRK